MIVCNSVSLNYRSLIILIILKPIVIISICIKKVDFLQKPSYTVSYISFESTNNQINR